MLSDGYPPFFINIVRLIKFITQCKTQDIPFIKRANCEPSAPIDYELGIIAGNFSIAPIPSLIIPGENDGKVSVESTKLSGMRDHVVISASHTFFPSNKEAHKQVLAFLGEGKFHGSA